MRPNRSASARLEAFGEALDLAAAGFGQLAASLAAVHGAHFFTAAAMTAIAGQTLEQSIAILDTLEAHERRRRQADRLEGPCLVCKHPGTSHLDGRGRCMGRTSSGASCRCGCFE